jgi:NAD(P)-dependent dehydrogenase (short-subunit alcohol dehydrogenase family)
MEMRTALLTGASRGVGRGAAIGLAECGFRRRDAYQTTAAFAHGRKPVPLTLETI